MVTPEEVLSPCKSLTSSVLHEKVRNCRNSGLTSREVTAELEQVIITRVNFGLVGAAHNRVLAVADCTNTVLTIWQSGCLSCIPSCQTDLNRPKASPLWSCLFLWAHEALWLGGGGCYRDFGHKQLFSATAGRARWRFSCSQMLSAVHPLENEAMKGSLKLFKLLQTNVYEIDNA